MLKLHRSILIGVLLLCASTAHGQNIISGIVKDANTGKTIPGANVYISHTTIGDATDDRGYYRIATSETGVYDLIFSFIGYKKAVVSVELTGNTSRTINATLMPDELVMEELRVSDSNKEWQKNFEKFREEFLGKTAFAKETTIENPTIIEFVNKDKRLIASIPEPLIVINKALGYKLYIELERFVWSSFTDGYYKVFPNYELLEPEDEAQKNTWKENREKAFGYSLQQFLRSLYHDKLSETDFTILNPDILIPLSRYETQYTLTGKPNLSPDFIKQIKGFKIIVNLSEGLHVNYIKYHNYKYNHRSVLIPNTDEKTFFIDANGNLLNPLSLKIQGFWGTHRIADQLPYDYDPE